MEQEKIKIICEFSKQTDEEQEERILYEVRVILQEALREYLDRNGGLR